MPAAPAPALTAPAAPGEREGARAGAAGGSAAHGEGRAARSAFARNVSWVGLGTVASKLVAVFVLGWSARAVGPALYGVLGFATSVAAYAGILVSPGLLTWGTRAIAQRRDEPARTIAVVNLTQLALAVVAYAALATYAATRQSAVERTVILVTGLTIFNTAVSIDWAYNGLELMRIPVRFQLLGSALTAVGLVLLVRGPGDVVAVAALPVAATAVATGAGYWYLFTRVGIRWTLPDLASMRSAWRDSLPLGATIALVVVLHYANVLLVRAFLGPEPLGLFMAAFRPLEMVSTVPNILATVFLPRLARVLTERPEAARHEARLFAEVHVAIGCLAAALLLAEAPAIVALLYGPAYAGAVPLLRVVAVGVLFNFVICGYTNCLISFGRDRVMLGVVVASAIVAVGGGLLFVPRFGALGAVAVVAAVDVVGWLVSLPAYRRAVGTIQWRAWTRPLAGGVLAAASALGLQRLGVPLGVRVPLALVPFAAVVARDLRGYLR